MRRLLTKAGSSSRVLFFFSSRRRHTRCSRDWSSDVCSSDLRPAEEKIKRADQQEREQHDKRALSADDDLADTECLVGERWRARAFRTEEPQDRKSVV